MRFRFRMKDKRANEIVRRAIQNGELVPPGKCEGCGRTENSLRAKRKRTIWAHHDDYSKPLIVRWVCPSCHMKWHLRNAPAPNYEPIRSAKRLGIGQIEEVRYLHSLGLSCAWIAEELGCSRTTVWRVIKRQRSAEGR